MSKGVQIIQQVMFPLFSTLQSDTKEFQRYFYQVVYVVSVVFFPVFFGMFAISKEIVVIVLSEKWLPSLFVFQIFTILGLLLSYSGIFIVILKSRAKTRILFKYSLYSAILLPVSIYISSNYGLDEVGVTWLIVYPIIFGYLFYQVLKEIEVGIVESLSKVSSAFLGSISMVIVITIFKQLIFAGEASVASMFFSIVVGGVSYFVYFWVFSRNTFQDARKIWKSLRS